MADTEVENILREIRERVHAEHEAAATAHSAGDNGATALEDRELEPAGSLPRLESYLSTTARAWDRLPPVVSNRSGTSARIELWLKRHFKRATRWYAWEQINFNAAVHHALSDMVRLLSANQETIQNLREQLRVESENRRADSGEVRTLLAEQRLTLDAESAIIAAVESRAVVVDDRLGAIVEATARLQEEQRVSYKQLALETSEAAVLEDRARRKTEALLEQLQRRIEELEARKIGIVNRK
ncbi:MAG TPA: hypothetical protein VGW76_06085 [Pyrinomonadaceae bacterium]|nr:hypothetical protein [Pyrinomonadaceae bacterium]